MDKNTLRLFFWERHLMLFFSEVSLRNASSLSDSSPLLSVWSLAVLHGVMLPALGEGRKKGKPQMNWDSLGKSVCIPLLISGYFIHFCTPAGDHEPCSESSACFLLQPFQMTSSCHSLFHPIANLKQVLALCVPPACHLSTQKRTARIFSEMNMN